MRGKRERLFECSHGVGPDEVRVVVLGWNPIQAAADMEEALVRAGFPAGGEIDVRDRRGKLVLRVPFRPPAAAHAG